MEANVNTNYEIQTEKLLFQGTLEDFFKNIVHGIPLEVEFLTLNSILYKTLHVNSSSLNPALKDALPYMLVHFIRSWPGWLKSSNYFNKQITLQNWYEKFKEYLIFKINYLIKNDFDKVMSLMKGSIPMNDSCSFKIDNSSQTQSSSEKEAAPFSIEITANPRILNTLVFCEGDKDDVQLKEYRVNTLWVEKISNRQLINWPFIEVEFRCKDLHFRRGSVHDFKRYLTFSTEKIFVKKAENFFEAIDIIDEKVPRQAYTLNAVREYCKVYISALKKHRAKLGQRDDFISEVESILEDFQMDISDIDMNSIATNTSVIFNIGRAIYARNKTIRTSDRAICFAESITPRVSLALFSFTAIKNPKKPFEHIKKIKHGQVKTLIPSLMYRCTFCNKKYDSSVDVWKHLKSLHIMEQPVLCFKCKLQFKITDLTANRWSHQCEPS